MSNSTTRISALRARKPSLIKTSSPDTLNYIWLQVDQNIYAKDSDAQTTQTAPDFKNLPLGQIEQLAARDYDGRINITNVSDAEGKDLKYTIVQNDDAD